MSVSAETYIVISLMFAVFAAVAAVGTSVVLGAGFERLRAGFEVVRRQSGFFADAIYKLDQHTQQLDAETSRLKSGLSGVQDRMERVEKQSAFTTEVVSHLEHRVEARPVMQTPNEEELRKPIMQAEGVIDLSMHRTPPSRPLERTLTEALQAHAPVQEEFGRSLQNEVESPDSPQDDAGIGSLLLRYFANDGRKDLVIH